MPYAGGASRRRGRALTQLARLQDQVWDEFIAVDDRLAALIHETLATMAEYGFDAAHDAGHLQRVMRVGLSLARFEEANEKVVLAAALLHDLVNVPKDSEKRSSASAMSGDVALPMLAQAGYSAEESQQIQVAIVEHSFSAGHVPSSLESAILQDADRLDDLGALGVLRTASVGTRLKAQYYHLTDPSAASRTLDDKQFTLDHFETKLLRLADKMNTTAARAEASRRHRFMVAFRDELLSEISSMHTMANENFSKERRDG